VGFKLHFNFLVAEDGQISDGHECYKMNVTKLPLFGKVTRCGTETLESPSRNLQISSLKDILSVLAVTDTK